MAEVPELAIYLVPKGVEDFLRKTEELVDKIDRMARGKAKEAKPSETRVEEKEEKAEEKRARKGILGWLSKMGAMLFMGYMSWRAVNKFAGIWTGALETMQTFIGLTLRPFFDLVGAMLMPFMIMMIQYVAVPLNRLMAPVLKWFLTDPVGKVLGKIFGGIMFMAMVLLAIKGLMASLNILQGLGTAGVTGGAVAGGVSLSALLVPVATALASFGVVGALMNKAMGGFDNVKKKADALADSLDGTAGDVARFGAELIHWAENLPPIAKEIVEGAGITIQGAVKMADDFAKGVKNASQKLSDAVDEFYHRVKDFEWTTGAVYESMATMGSAYWSKEGGPTAYGRYPYKEGGPFATQTVIEKVEINMGADLLETYRQRDSINSILDWALDRLSQRG